MPCVFSILSALSTDLTTLMGGEKLTVIYKRLPRSLKEIGLPGEIVF